MLSRFLYDTRGLLYLRMGKRWRVRCPTLDELHVGSR